MIGSLECISSVRKLIFRMTAGQMDITQLDDDLVPILNPQTGPQKPPVIS